MNIWSILEYEFLVRIATWNINSVRLRIAHVLRFIKEQNIDVMCLQETFKIMKLFISLLTCILYLPALFLMKLHVSGIW